MSTKGTVGRSGSEGRPTEQYLRFKLGPSTFVDIYVEGPLGYHELAAFRGQLREMDEKGVVDVEPSQTEEAVEQ